MNSELLSARVPSSLVPIALEVCKVTGLLRPLIAKVDERTDGQWVTLEWGRSSSVLVINCLQDGAKGKVMRHRNVLRFHSAWGGAFCSIFAAIRSDFPSLTGTTHIYYFLQTSILEGQGERVPI